MESINKKEFNKNKIFLNDNIMIMKLCLTAITNYHSIIVLERNQRKKLSYGSELFFDFEYLSYTFAGMAQRIIDGKSLGLEEVNLIRKIEINKQDAISKFIEDSQSWEKIPGVVTEYILWMSLIRALKEYTQNIN